MKLYGVAAALTGNPKFGAGMQPIVDLTCTTLSVDRDRLYTKRLLPAHTFKIRFDSTDPDQMRQAFRHVSAALSRAVSRQAAGFSEENIDYRPVAFIVGRDARVTYAFPDIRKTFLECERGDAGIRRQLAQDLKKSYLRLSYYQTINAPHSEKVESLDAALREVNAAVSLGEYDEHEALERRIQIAEDLGREIAIQVADKYPTFIGWTMGRFQKMSLRELEISQPIYAFDQSNILIRQAITRGYKEQARVDGVYIGNPYIKPPLEPKSRFFADVAHAMIWNQDSVIKGTDTVEDTSYQDEPKYRAQLVEDMSATL